MVEALCPYKISVLIRKNLIRKLSISFCVHSEKIVIYKPEGEPSSGTKLAGTFLLGFEASRTVGNKFKPPNLWYCVMAA